MSYLEANEVKVTNGGRLSPNRWQHLGMDFGMHSTLSYYSYINMSSVFLQMASIVFIVRLKYSVPPPSS